jgi:hypothetical protein
MLTEMVGGDFRFQLLSPKTTSTSSLIVILTFVHKAQLVMPLPRLSLEDGCPNNMDPLLMIKGRNLY